MSDLEQAAYFEGFSAACQAMREARIPIACPCDTVAPDWVRLPTLRAYQWRRGFAFCWNRVRIKRGWPDWTEMRLILTPPKESA